MVVPSLALHIVYGVGDSGMVTACDSTLGGGWVLFCFCSTILVCVLVVSTLVFGVIWPWDITTSFLIVFSFSLPKGANGAAGAIFFSTLIKYVATWVAASAKEIPVILVFSGKNYIVSIMCSSIVLEI